ncbi:MAG: nodulation protein NfeD [Elusimicrobia bacterium]|nr:nodulation protein NfeD [Elusimicrobiota bacterium]
MFGRAFVPGLIALLFGSPVLASEARPRVLLASYSGIINPASAEYLSGALGKAAAGSYDALVIELDTPGGLDLSMREIVKGILGSPIPVAVYVWPSGGRAASAGVFITMAAHVAAMAPGTNIGAAHPIQLGVSGVKEKEAKDSVMEEKVANDLTAYLKAIASRRGRNADWAFQVVSKSTSVISSEAVRRNIVDLEAKDLDELLARMDGKVLKDFPGRPLRVRGAAIERFEMTRRQRLLAAVSDPNIAMILMTLGVSGLLIELYSPGLILPGIVGAVSLILAFYSFQTLSAGYAGVLLILLGFLLYILELKIASFGLLALSGTAALFMGGLMVFRDTGLEAAVFGGLLYVTKQSFSKKSGIGAGGLVGSRAVVEVALEPLGTVRLGGELWRAKSLAGAIPAGAEVEVVRVDGLTLGVRSRRQLEE